MPICLFMELHMTKEAEGISFIMSSQDGWKKLCIPPTFIYLGTLVVLSDHWHFWNTQEANTCFKLSANLKLIFCFLLDAEMLNALDILYLLGNLFLRPMHFSSNVCTPTVFIMRRSHCLCWILYVISIASESAGTHNPWRTETKSGTNAEDLKPWASTIH